MNRSRILVGPIVILLSFILILNSSCLCSALLDPLLKDVKLPPGVSQLLPPTAPDKPPAPSTSPPSSPGSTTPTMNSDEVLPGDLPPPLPAPKRQLPDTPPPPFKPVTGNIQVGATISIGSAAVGPEGGSAALKAPGTPLDGLVLDVPAKAYPDQRSFKISYAPVTSHTFGADFNPISPLITIDNGGAYADIPMNLTVPVKVPAGHFAMGFFYDEAKQKLEGMPLVDLTPTSITVSTLHFSKFIFGSIPENLLTGAVDSGFRPGIDDWEFPNAGSYIAPNGHCAGQSLGAMWYYIEKPDGPNAHLWGRYDNNGQKPATEDLWLDDSYAYRFCSVLQVDYVKGNTNSNLLGTLGNALKGTIDRLQYNAFRYSILKTGEPQMVGISSKAGGGHAMVIYKVDDTGLWVSDPNKPSNNFRKIEYANGAFKPYNSAANAVDEAQGKGMSYESIGYKAKSAYVSWSGVAKRWAELKAGTIGNDLFPDAQLQWKDDLGNRNDLVDGMAIPDAKLKLGSKATERNSRTSFKVFRDGKELPCDSQGKYDLNPGNNLLGIYTVKERNGDYNYLDFKYVNIVSGAALPTGSADQIKYRTAGSPFGTATNPINVSLGGKISGDPGLKFEGTEFYAKYAGRSNVLAFVYSIPASATITTLDFEGVTLQLEPAKKEIKITGTQPWSNATTQTIDYAHTWVTGGVDSWTKGPAKAKFEGEFSGDPWKPASGSKLVVLDPARSGEGIAWKSAGGVLFNCGYSYKSLRTYRDLGTNAIGAQSTIPANMNEIVAIRLVKR